MSAPVLGTARVRIGGATYDLKQDLGHHIWGGVYDMHDLKQDLGQGSHISGDVSCHKL